MLAGTDYEMATAEDIVMGMTNTRRTPDDLRPSVSSPEEAGRDSYRWLSNTYTAWAIVFRECRCGRRQFFQFAIGGHPNERVAPKISGYPPVGAAIARALKLYLYTARRSRVKHREQSANLTCPSGQSLATEMRHPPKKCRAGNKRPQCCLRRILRPLNAIGTKF